MIAVDTNVLLRRLLDDDAIQSPKARRLFEASHDVLITDVVLAETVWVLTGKRYKASKDDILAMITGLLEEPRVLFENRAAIWSALNEYANAAPVRTRSGLRELEFPDALIANKAKLIAQRRGDTFDGTYTFDQVALKLDGMKSP